MPATKQLREILPGLQPASERPLVLRQIPIWEDGVATGYVDLALERAYIYRKGAPSEVIALPDGIKDRERDARFHMLEQLADYDDELMEQLLSDAAPDDARIFADLARETGEGLICPVMFGSARTAMAFCVSSRRCAMMCRSRSRHRSGSVFRREQRAPMW